MSYNIYPYVEDEVFLSEVKRVLNAVDQSIEDADVILHSNVVDPFSAFFDAASQNISYKEWVDQERHRQVQKTLQNAIGYFHQNILGSVKGWTNPGVGGGYDIENTKKRIIGEIKNKHNTFNSSSADATYEKMCRFLANKGDGYTAYVVIIIPKSARRYTKPFAPSGKLIKDNLLEVDGARFYEMVTGDKDALKLLFESLPKAIAILKNKEKLKTETALFFSLYIKAYGI